MVIVRNLLHSQLTSDPAWTIQDLDDKLLSSLTHDESSTPESPAGESTAESPGEHQLPQTCFCGTGQAECNRRVGCW